MTLEADVLNFKQQLSIGEWHPSDELELGYWFKEDVEIPGGMSVIPPSLLQEFVKSPYHGYELATDNKEYDVYSGDWQHCVRSTWCKVVQML